MEDNPADVYLLRKALQEAGLNFELTVINDGIKALELFRNPANLAQMPDPDLAILDLNMPGAGGIEVLTAIRQSPGVADVPVAVITSSADLRERRRAEELGIERFIVKPHDLDSSLQIGHVLKEVLLGRSPSGGGII
ncbi:MAG: response regulator [Acidobacteriota bacterium]